MGSAPAHLLGTIIMKFLLLAATLASVHAEANPAFTYATGYHLPYAIGAPLAYTTHAVAPVVYTAAAGCQNDAGAVVPCAHGGLVGVVPAAPVAAAEPAVEEARKKREATAEPEADPEAEAEAWLFYRTHGYCGRKKREATAEADAEASPEADPWLLYGGYGLPYGGYYGYGYHHAPYAYLGGCRNYLGGLVPCAGR